MHARQPCVALGIQENTKYLLSISESPRRRRGRLWQLFAQNSGADWRCVEVCWCWSSLSDDHQMSAGKTVPHYLSTGSGPLTTEYNKHSLNISQIFTSQPSRDSYISFYRKRKFFPMLISTVTISHHYSALTCSNFFIIRNKISVAQKFGLIAYD